jgi:hypothetical protein
VSPLVLVAVPVLVSVSILCVLLSPVVLVAFPVAASLRLPVVACLVVCLFVPSLLCPSFLFTLLDAVVLLAALALLVSVLSLRGCTSFSDSPAWPWVRHALWAHCLHAACHRVNALRPSLVEHRRSRADRKSADQMVG